MNALQSLYPGISTPNDWKSFLSEEDIDELNAILLPSFAKLKGQFPKQSSLPDLKYRSPDDLINYFREEKYFNGDGEATLSNGIISKLYYLIRPLLPVSARSILQRYSLRNWKDIRFPEWPLDTTADTIAGFFIEKASKSKQDNSSFIWFWPGNYKAGLILTHDVETEAGLNNCRRIMDIEEKYGFRSAFEIIPENRYPVDISLLNEIKQRGFEVCIHGLNHDGHLFKSREVFNSRVEKIKHYASEYGATGFRSPVMYRELKWISELGFSYDMSFPTVGHLDPQRGGCCTTFPFFNGDTLELPLTTMQDYSLFHILNRDDIGIWSTQIEQIIAKNGLVSFIIHPDYILSEKRFNMYEELLALLFQQDSLWHGLPRELDAWWRAKAQVGDITKLDLLRNNKSYDWDPKTRTLPQI